MRILDFEHMRGGEIQMEEHLLWAAFLRRLLLFGGDYGLEILLSSLLAVAAVGCVRGSAGHLLCLVDCCLLDVGAIHHGERRRG